MLRDPTGFECKRDPIFLFQNGRRQWTEIPNGMSSDGDGLCVDEFDLLPDWIKPFVDEDECLSESDEFWSAAEQAEGEWGWPVVYIEWRTERVFLTREEAEAFGTATSYRYDKWRVYCVPCEGRLAELLNETDG